MWKHIAANGLTLLVVFILAAGFGVSWARQEFRAPGPLAEAVCVKVPSGSNFGKVADNLGELGAVSSVPLFRVSANYSGKAADLKAGSFLVPAGASMEQILAAVTGVGVSTCGTEVVLQIGVSKTEIEVREMNSVTNEAEKIAEFVPGTDAVPAEFTKALDEGDTRFSIAMAEGVTVWQVGEALKAAEFLSGDVGELPGEGMLAPDTYEVKKGADRAEIIAGMNAEQLVRIEEIWASRNEGLPFSTPEEMLVMASIVEKETGIASERPRVASVFVNRLRQGIKLQTDPTVIYGVTKGQGGLGRGLRQSELKRETPYNTYVIDGLPPGPIANPGEAAMRAAVAPEFTNFLFFVADGTGGHAFAETLEEHNRNVEHWREIEAERAAAAEAAGTGN